MKWSWQSDGANKTLLEEPRTTMTDKKIKTIGWAVKQFLAAAAQISVGGA